MGNAVLMPQLYGLAIKRAPSDYPRNDIVTQNNQSAEVRKIAYKSTYDDFSEPSICSMQKNGSTLLQSHCKKDSKAQQVHLRTKQSVDSARSAELTRGREENRYNAVDFYSKREQFQQKAANEEDPFSDTFGSNGDGSIIDQLLQFPETEQQKQAIKQKCKILIDLGERAWRGGYFKKSVQYLQQVLRQSSSKYPDDYEQKAKLYSILGNSCLRLQVYDKAADYYHRSLEILEKSPEVNYKKCSDVHLSLGTIYQQTDHLNEAIEHFDVSYKLKKSRLARNSPELLGSLHNLANLQIRRGNHMKAIERFTEALAINRSLYGSNHFEIARNFYYMAMSLFSIREYSMWLQYHYQSIRMMKDLKLQRHPQYAVWLNSFKLNLIELVNVQKYAKDVVERSISMAVLLLNEDEQIDFLSKVKGNLEKSIASERG